MWPQVPPATAWLPPSCRVDVFQLRQSAASSRRAPTRFSSLPQVATARLPPSCRLAAAQLPPLAASRRPFLFFLQFAPGHPSYRPAIAKLPPSCHPTAPSYHAAAPSYSAVAPRIPQQPSRYHAATAQILTRYHPQQPCDGFFRSERDATCHICLRPRTSANVRERHDPAAPQRPRSYRPVAPSHSPAAAELPRRYRPVSVQLPPSYRSQAPIDGTLPWEHQAWAKVHDGPRTSANVREYL